VRVLDERNSALRVCVERTNEKGWMLKQDSHGTDVIQPIDNHGYMMLDRILKAFPGNKSTTHSKIERKISPVQPREREIEKVGKVKNIKDEKEAVVETELEDSLRKLALFYSKGKSFITMEDMIDGDMSIAKHTKEESEVVKTKAGKIFRSISQKDEKRVSLEAFRAFLVSTLAEKFGFTTEESMTEFIRALLIKVTPKR